MQIYHLYCKEKRDCFFFYWILAQRCVYYHLSYEIARYLSTILDCFSKIGAGQLSYR